MLILLNIHAIPEHTCKSSGGSRISCRGAMDLQCGHFLTKKYVKMKELGSLGGCAPRTPPRSANEKGPKNILYHNVKWTISRNLCQIQKLQVLQI